MAPGLATAVRLKHAVEGAEDISSAPADHAKGSLQDAKHDWHDLNIGPGLSQIDAARDRYRARHQHAVSAAAGHSQHAAAALHGLIGTTDYAGVAAIYTLLDHAIAGYNAFEDLSAQVYGSELDAIIGAHDTLIERSVTPLDIVVPADNSPRGGD